jgi:putative methionine-R-sulfoxide reductase with GAF domain
MSKTATLAQTGAQKTEHFDVVIIGAGICSSVVRARRSAIEEETTCHEQHCSRRQ